uniref:DUF2142 domain-containing protein n=1 Tax=uncultured Arcanobacterium sp. TaxID=487520 RepID=UPI0026391D92
MKGKSSFLAFGAIVFIALFLLSLAWAFIVPVRLQADETAHATNAAGVVRGQLIVEGKKVIYPDTGSIITEHKVVVPSSYDRVQDGALCLIKKPNNPDSCVIPIPDASATDVAVFTPAANYPPLYYLLTGWPTLFLDGAKAWLAVRLITSLVCSLLLTGAILGLAPIYGKVPALSALALITPTAFSYNGAINPAGPEIAACFMLAAWLAPLISLKHASVKRFVIVGISAFFSVLMRPTSAFWVFLIIVLVALTLSVEKWRQLLRFKGFWIGVGIAGFGTTLSVLWYLAARPGDSILGWIDPSMTMVTMLKVLAKKTPMFWESIIGNFGWVDNPVPLSLQILAVILFASIFIYALRLGNKREKFVIFLGLILLPVSAIGIQ